MTDNLIWKRDAVMDTYEATSGDHKFLCVRTAFDVAVLYHNDVEVRRNASDGSHRNNREFAETLLAELKGQDDE